ncbi:hypothetical protein [Vreelandella utahensis]|uniref:hypothetical protein n=1 Tax=Vreelandella halophila TaxID=86177 RepID=UPI0009863DC5|nr:hypothetical protein [Halomonas utahensis]
MPAEKRWLRYRRDSILFATVWLVVGLGTLHFGSVEGGAAGRAAAWAMAISSLPVVVSAASAIGVIWILTTSDSGSSIRRIVLTFSLLGVLLPLQLFAVTYAVTAAKEATAGLLVISATLAWPGVANLGAVLLTERGLRKQ